MRKTSGKPELSETCLPLGGKMSGNRENFSCLA
jgi:hypothetical protein